MSFKKKGFTLVELLAVIVILTIVLAIAVPTITGIIKKATINAFEQDAKMLIKAIDYQVLQESDLDINVISASNIESKLGISNNNYDFLSIVLDENNKHYIYIEGKNKWADLVACGTFSNITVETKDSIDVCKAPEGNGPEGWACGQPFTDTRTDNGNSSQVYETKELGGLCWMTEDLRWKCSNYSGADMPPGWESATDMCAPSGSANDVDYSDTILYQWDAANVVCPSGWHLPTDEEWQQLEMALGMTQVDAGNIGWRGITEKVGDKLKGDVKKNWCNSIGNECYSSGFNANPAGCRYSSTGAFSSVGLFGYWWSSTEDDSYAWLRSLLVSGSDVHRYSDSKAFGLAVRCVAD